MSRILTPPIAGSTRNLNGHSHTDRSSDGGCGLCSAGGCARLRGRFKLGQGSATRALSSESIDPSHTVVS
eukprot:2028432-Rhodomonas_salina.1